MKLKAFMEKIDSKIANFGVFNQKEDNLDEMTGMDGSTSIQ